MNIPMIEMDPQAAKLAFRDYRAAVKLARDDRRRKEDDLTARAFQAASKGLKVLDLHQAMKQAGVQASGYPALAISRADQERCFLQTYYSGAAIFAYSTNAFWSSRRIRAGLRLSLPEGTFPRETGGLRNAQALVPSIPPALRPKHHLSNYHILWEAVWEPAPPVDPLLLKHLGGALYAVLAAWDLTEIERAVLRGRLV